MFARAIGGGPLGKPTYVSNSDDGGWVRVTWTSGDASAGTYIDIVQNGTSYNRITAGPGVTAVTSGQATYPITDPNSSITLRHFKNGVESAADVTNSFP